MIYIELRTLVYIQLIHSQVICWTICILIEFVWNEIAFIYYQTMGPIAGLKWTKTRKHLHLQNALRLAGTNEFGVPKHSFLKMEKKLCSFCFGWSELCFGWSEQTAC